MNEVLIKNWNSVVTKEDTVYTLGDMHWGKATEVLDFIKQLNGHIVCIKGNHSLKQFPKELKNRLDDIRDYKEINDNGKHVIMSHYPIMTYRHSGDNNVYMLHGHTHQLTTEQDWVEKWTRELRQARKDYPDNCGNIINVGCMMPYMEFTPKPLDQIIEGWKKYYSYK
jgi:calcineurin-like phosphoesterase family protein